MILISFVRIKYSIPSFYHQFLVYSLVFPIYQHIQTAQSRALLFVALGLFVITTIARAIIQPSYWPSSADKLVNDTGDYLRIRLRGRHIWKVQPGHYLRIWTPRASLLRSHPVQVLWWGKDVHQEFFVELAVPSSLKVTRKNAGKFRSRGF